MSRVDDPRQAGNSPSTVVQLLAYMSTLAALLLAMGLIIWRLWGEVGGTLTVATNTATPEDEAVEQQPLEQQQPSSPVEASGQSRAAEQSPTQDLPFERDIRIGVGSGGLVLTVWDHPQRVVDPQGSLGTLAGAEFKQALLRREEFALLKGQSVRELQGTSAGAEALRKVAKLFWYGKILGRQPSLVALLPQLHPTVREAVLGNPDLSPEAR